MTAFPPGRAALALLALLLAGCSTALLTPAPGTAPAATAGCTADPATSARALALVNAERRARGLRPVTVNARLVAAAQGHACDNMRRGVYTHTGSDGSTLSARLGRQGYRLRAAAENTGLGFEEAPERLVAFWMRSPGHRDNILDPDFTEAGLARAKGPRSAWVLVLATGF